MFKVFDSTLAEHLPDIAGVWKTLSRPVPGNVEFTVKQKIDALAPLGAPLWRVELPANLESAAKQLETEARRVTLSEHVWPTLPDQIEHLMVAQHHTQGQMPPSHLAQILMDLPRIHFINQVRHQDDQ